MSQKASLKPSESESDFIRGIPLFSGLSQEEKDSLLKDGRVTSYQRRQTIFRQGDSLQNLYIVCSGIVQIYRSTPEGREVTLDILIGGDMTCTREIFELSGVHTANAAAVNGATIMSFPKVWLLDAARKNSVFALNLLSAISRRARMTEVDAEHQATMSAPQLVACFLQVLCATYNFNPRGFDLPISKSLIASRLGMELETFSRALPVLKKYGITVRGKTVVFHDFPSLEEHVCGHCSVMDTCSARKMVRQKRDEVRQLSRAEFQLV
jgi:CRP-like cAMP-binding protein